MNGASVAKADFDGLYEVIGDKFGNVDSDHFNLPDTHHRFLEGTTNIAEVGGYISAGLPNILGTVSGIKFQKADPSTGAFEGDGIQFVEGINNSNPSQNQMYSWSRPNFSATRSSSIYGNSSTVHPDSLRFLALIRSY